MTERNNRREPRKKMLLRALLAVILLCTALSLLGDLICLLLNGMGGISFPVKNAVTIGIIGGSDGPTAVFLTASKPHLWQTALKFVVLCMGIIGIHKWK